jgi:hypothetical protein
MILVYPQVVKNESKRKWKHPYVSIAKGMKSLPNFHSTYDHVFSWAAIIATCVVVNSHWTISIWVKLTMTTSIKIRKLSLVIIICTCHQIWLGKRWETLLWTCTSLSKIIVVTISQSVSWDVIQLLFMTLYFFYNFSCRLFDFMFAWRRFCFC